MHEISAVKNQSPLNWSVLCPYSFPYFASMIQNMHSVELAESGLTYNGWVFFFVVFVNFTALKCHFYGACSAVLVFPEGNYFSVNLQIFLGCMNHLQYFSQIHCFSLFKILFLCKWVFPTCISVYRVYTVPSEARKGCHIPWNCNNRKL